MKDISEISLHVFDELEKIQEVCLFQPLESPKKRLTHKKKAVLFGLKPDKLKSLIIHMFKWLIPSIRKDKAAIFKTAVASLLSQPPWKGDKREQLNLQVIQQVAKSYGIVNEEESLTCLSNGIELKNNAKELALQRIILGDEAIKQVQCHILDEIHRLPISSKLSISHPLGQEEFNFKTSYKKYKVHEIDSKGCITYQAHCNKGTSSIRTKESIFPDLRGVVGQRLVHNPEQNQLIGSYSGELSTMHNVLEQVLCLLNLGDSAVTITKDIPGEEEVILLFTSLYAWHEFDLISNQKEAILHLNHKTLQCGDKAIRLRLLYMNIPFNAWARLPTPPETGAILQDLNDTAIIYLTYLTFRQLNLPTAQLEQWICQLDQEDADFFKKAQKRNDIIDAFRSQHTELLARIEMKQERLAHVLKVLLIKKRPDGRALRGIDHLLYLEELTKSLNIIHHKNCQQSLFRSSAAKAADKAQHVFVELSQAPFLPGISTPLDNNLFSSLYSLYLLWEEPDIHHVMSTGEADSFVSAVRKNPEAARYLTRRI